MDDDEGRSAEPGGEPEAAATGGNLVANAEQRAHRVVGDFIRLVECFNEEEGGDLVEVVGDDEFAVVADAEAKPTDFDDGRDADGDEDAGEDEERGVGIGAAGVSGSGVGADGDEAELRDLDEEQTVIFDGWAVALEQCSGDGDARAFKA